MPTSQQQSNSCGDEIIDAPDLVFTRSCAIHDNDYDFPKMARSEADLKFLKNMLNDAKNSKFPLYYSVIAYFYYYAVRIFGEKRYNLTKK